MTEPFRGQLSLDKAIEICRPKVPVRPPAGGAWPKMLYHSRLAPKGQVFESEEAFLTNAPDGGWREKPHADEKEAQQKETIQGREEEVISLGAAEAGAAVSAPASNK